MARFDIIDLAKHRHAVAASSIGLLAVIVLGDLLTGFELSLSSLYLVPVALITLGFGMRAGVSMALIAYGAWIGINSAGALERSVTLTTVRLKVEQNQLVSVVGWFDLRPIGLQGA